MASKSSGSNDFSVCILWVFVTFLGIVCDISLHSSQVRAPGAQIIVVGTHLDVFRRSEGKNTENLLEEYRKRILQEFTSQDRTFPKIRKVVFVGLNEATGFFGTTTKYDDLNDIIHEEASNMEIPKSNYMFDQSFCPFCVINPGHHPHVSYLFHISFN